LRAIKNTAAAENRSPYVNSKDKKAKDALGTEPEKRGASAVKDETDTVSMASKAKSRTSKAQSKPGADKSPVDNKKENPASKAVKARTGENQVSDRGMPNNIIELARKGILSNPTTAFQAHRNITPENVLQLIG